MLCLYRDVTFSVGCPAVTDAVLHPLQRHTGVIWTVFSLTEQNQTVNDGVAHSRIGTLDQPVAA